MMSASIRRKALSLCSSALKNNGVVQSLERAQPALAGSRIVPETHLGAPIYSKPLRDVVSSSKADFTTQKWIRAFSTFSESAAGGDIGKRAEQIGTVKVNFDIEKVGSTSGLRRQNSPAFFTASGAVVGSALSTPQATKLGMGSTVSSTFLPNLALFWHINNGIEEILADYVHHEMTRSLILVLMRLFLIVAAKDVFVATN